MKLLIMDIGSKKYAIPVPLIREIIERIKYTEIDRAPNEVLGLMNLRGQIVTLLCPGVNFGSDRPIRESVNWAVVIKKQSELNENQKKELEPKALVEDLYALQIDNVPEVVDVSADLEPVPGNTPKEEAMFLSGIARVDGVLYPVLDVSIFVQAVEEPELQGV